MKGDMDMNLQIHAGEVLGLGGLVGAGRTELAEAIDLGIALVPEDRKRHGALLTNSIKKNINMPIYERISRFSVINTKAENDNEEKYRKEIQIKCPTTEQLVKNLSGGNQQKVILGKWLAVIISLLMSTLIGVLNGFMVATIGIPALIATFASQTIFEGASYLISGGMPISGFTKSFDLFGRTSIGILPVSVIIMAACFAIGSFILNKTYFGRYFYAIGISGMMHGFIALAAAVHAAKRFPDIKNAKVVVEGAGPIGILTAQACKALGASEVMITDISDMRLELAKSVGCDYAFNTMHKDFGEAMIECFGPDKADVIYDCAGNDITMNAAIQNAPQGKHDRPGGSICQDGQRGPGQAQ